MSLTTGLLRTILTTLNGSGSLGLQTDVCHITDYLALFTGDNRDHCAGKADVLPLSNGTLVRKTYPVADFLREPLKKYCCLIFC